MGPQKTKTTKNKKRISSHKIHKEKVPIEEILLRSIFLIGVLSVAVVAPNALQMFKIFGINKRKYPKRYLNNAISRLKNKGYIKFEETSKGTFVKLTKEGKRKLQKYQMKRESVKKPKKWDKKWRVVIFDIKEKNRSLRNKIRKELVGIGFVKLQNSVWVFPYECEELLIMLKANFKIGKDVLYLRVESLENDKQIKKIFGLNN